MQKGPPSWPTGRRHHNQRAPDVDRPFFDVAAAEQVLVKATSHRPMDDALGLGVVPQQIALVVGQFAHSIIVQTANQICDLSRPKLFRVYSAGPPPGAKAGS